MVGDIALTHHKNAANAAEQPMRLSVGIAGAGLLGRLLAYQLSHAGHHITVFDPAPSAQPADAHRNAGFTAAGMLSPIAELDNAEPAVAALGWRSIALWQGLVQALPKQATVPMLSVQGSIMLAHRGDAGAAQRILSRIRHAYQSPDWQSKAPAQTDIQAIDKAPLQKLEPSLQGHAQAWLLPQEGMIDTVAMMQALYDNAMGVDWKWGQCVSTLDTSGAITLENGEQRVFDAGIDARGVGAKVLNAAMNRQSNGLGVDSHLRGNDERKEGAYGRKSSGAPTPQTPTNPVEKTKYKPLVIPAHAGIHSTYTENNPINIRGVRGETIWLGLKNHGLTRPVRLLHPRHRVYMVPRNTDTIIVGASEIESEDYSPVSLRSAVELMAAAHSVMPELAEARIVKMESNCRPATPDNNPVAQWDDKRLTINGLFRHGWLLAPALVEQALHDADCPLIVKEMGF